MVSTHKHSILLKSSVTCHTSKNSNSRRVISHNRQDLTLLLVRFKAYLNKGCKLADTV